MGVWPRMVKFKAPHNTFFRRLRKVKSIALVDNTENPCDSWYEVVMLNGAKAVLPYEGTIVLVGREVEFHQ